MPALVCLDLHVGRPCQPLWDSSLTVARSIAWWWSYIRAVQVPLAHISNTCEFHPHQGAACKLLLPIYSAMSMRAKGALSHSFTNPNVSSSLHSPSQLFRTQVSNKNSSLFTPHPLGVKTTSSSNPNQT